MVEESTLDPMDEQPDETPAALWPPDLESSDASAAKIKEIPAASMGPPARIDPETGHSLTAINVGGRPAGLAVEIDGFLWATIQGP